jgi:hypothetical protein
VRPATDPDGHLQTAVEHLPETCRYHGERILNLDCRFSGNWVDSDFGHVVPCCDTGTGAFLRYFAAQSLGLPTIQAATR